MASRFGAPGLAVDVVSNFLHLKGADGYVPRTISPGRIWDSGDLCKPFLCQALLHDVQSGDTTIGAVAPLLDDLDCYLQYYARTRRSKSGLYHWRNVLESGVDDNLALLYPVEAAKDENESNGYPDARLLAVDLNSYLVYEIRAFAQLCSLAKRHPDEVTKYNQEADRLVALIDEQLWNPALNMYCNLDPVTNQFETIRAWTGLLPAIFGFAKSNRIKITLEEVLLNPKHFYRPSGLASVAVSEPLYNNAKRGLYGRAIVSNWQGPMWVLPNALAVEGLVKQGYKNEAVDLAKRCILTLCRSLNEKGTLFENYNAETGDALWAPNFMSWNALSLSLIDLLD
jgi:putative isomerase